MLHVYNTEYYDCELWADPIRSNFQFNWCMRALVCVSVFIGFSNSIYYYFIRKLLILHNSSWSTEPIASFIPILSLYFHFDIKIEEVKGHVVLYSYRKKVCLFFLSVYFSFQLEYCVIRWVNGATGYLLFHCYFPLKCHLLFFFFYLFRFIQIEWNYIWNQK